MPWQTVALIIGAVAVIVFYGYSRAVSGPTMFLGSRTLLAAGVYFLVRAALDRYSQRR